MSAVWQRSGFGTILGLIVICEQIGEQCVDIVLFGLDLRRGWWLSNDRTCPGLITAKRRRYLGRSSRGRFHLLSTRLIRMGGG